MRIAFVTCHFPPDSIGGGQMQSKRLCEALGQKYKVTVFTRVYKKNVTLEEQGNSYLLRKRRTFNLPVIKSIIDIIKVLLQIKRYKGEIDVCISFHLQLASLMVVLSKFFYGTKAIVSPRGFEDFDFKWYKKGFQKFIYNNADIILIQSEKIKENFLLQTKSRYSLNKYESIKNKIRIFPNGIKVPKNFHKKLSERPNQIIFVGRLEPIKGIFTLLDAFRLCDQQNKLLIIGDGSLRNSLQKYSEDLNVTFLGQCTEIEVNHYLQYSRLLVLPSLSENFPNVILEAFCAGVPVVASRVGAIPELIEEGTNGYLVPPCSAPDLAKKINAILSNAGDLDKMGQNAYYQVSKYDWENLINKFETIVKAN